MRILLIQPTLDPPGGGNLVAARARQVLRRARHATTGALARGANPVSTAVRIVWYPLEWQYVGRRTWMQGLID